LKKEVKRGREKARTQERKEKGGKTKRSTIERPCEKSPLRKKERPCISNLD